MMDRSVTIDELGTLDYVKQYRDKWFPNVEIVNEIPDGWRVIEGARTAPIGATWVGRGSFFRHDHQHALLFTGI